MQAIILLTLLALGFSLWLIFSAVGALMKVHDDWSAGRRKRRAERQQGAHRAKIQRVRDGNPVHIAGTPDFESLARAIRVVQQARYQCDRIFPQVRWQGERITGIFATFPSRGQDRVFSTGIMAVIMMRLF